MNDLIKRLRATGVDKDNFTRMDSELACPVGLALEAADELERLAEYDAFVRRLNPDPEWVLAPGGGMTAGLPERSEINAMAEGDTNGRS